MAIGESGQRKRGPIKAEQREEQHKKEEEETRDEHTIGNS